MALPALKTDERAIAVIVGVMNVVIMGVDKQSKGFRFGTVVRLDRNGEEVELTEDPTDLLYIAQKGMFTVISAPEKGPGAGLA